MSDVRDAADTAKPKYPHSGTCDYCHRDRDDLFWHAEDEAYYCVDVFRCEARWQIQASRNDLERRLDWECANRSQS